MRYQELLEPARYLVVAILFCVALYSVAAADTAAPTSAPPNSKLWITAYYLSGDDGTPRMPLDKVDFHAISHVIDFAIFPNADGTIDQTRVMSAKHSAALIAAAHAAGCKVILGLASDDGTVKLRSSVSDKYRAAFVKNLVDMVVSRGYDGLDLDFEPLEDKDIPTFTAFSDGLRRTLDASRPGLLLTAAVASEPGLFAIIQNDYDQINLMTYDLSGEYQDFKSWYNASLYGDPSQTMENYQAYPSCDQMVQQFIQAGVAPSKLAVGIAFYGYIWTGISGPRQAIAGRKDITINDGADYSLIMDKYYSPSVYHWDDVAHAPYLSIVGATPADSKFITYDDDRLAAEKVSYATKMRLGGCMIWELGGGYRPSQPEGQRDALLQAVKQAWLGGAAPAAQ